MTFSLWRVKRSLRRCQGPPRTCPRMISGRVAREILTGPKFFRIIRVMTREDRPG